MSRDAGFVHPDYSPRLRQAGHNLKQKDDELLELGERLVSIQPKLASMLRWVDEVRDLLATEVRRRGMWPDDTAEWTWRDAASYCAARECVERETEIGAAYIRAMDALEACYSRVDPTATQYCRSSQAREKAAS